MVGIVALTIWNVFGTPTAMNVNALNELGWWKTLKDNFVWRYLYWFTWLRIEIHLSLAKSFRVFFFFYYVVYVCQCLYDFFSYFSNPATFTKKWRFFCIKVLYLINIDFMLSMIWGQLHSGQYNWSFLLILAFI